MKKSLLIVVLILGLINEVKSQTIKIGLFNQYKINAIVISPIYGEYELIGDETFKQNLNNSSILYLTRIGNQIQVKSTKGIEGIFSNIKLKGSQTNNAIRIKPNSPKLEAREYEGDFNIRIKKQRLKIINLVNLESYIAGVVESEGGGKAKEEYYKTQAILCRTYALENFQKHQKDSFNLCDGVHCQAYMGRTKENDTIILSTYSTKDLVIVDNSLNLITAAFYSNSGGQTAASEMVWQQKRPYLKSIVDTFSIGEQNYEWSKTISYKQWLQFLKKKGFKLSPKTNGSEFTSNTFVRTKFYKFGNKSVSYTDIRRAFNLRSAYFTIAYEKNQITFNGRGYGHGVGLSQEGAMNMANNGYSYKDIIKFYYQDVFIVSSRSLQFFEN